jgi:multiple sugar transport system ATP-binding protein
MHQGRIEQLGTPDEVYHRPANRYVAAFLGSPGMNFIAGQLFAGPGGARFEAPGLSLPLPAGAPASASLQELANAAGRAVTLGLRPEQLRLVPAGSSDCLGTATLVEPHGGHRVAWLDCACGSLAVLDHSPLAGPGLKPGDPIGVSCGSATALLFDPATGQRI